MIKVSVDEALAFDMLSVLYVKARAGLPVMDQIKALSQEISAQVPVAGMVEMSDEFTGLMDANEGNFQAVELANDNAISSRELQQWNKKRVDARRKLQQKFWPEKPLTEIKSPKASDQR